MKVGGGLYYVTGPMGAGKSLFGVRQGVEALSHGRYWITNQELLPDAFERMAAHYGRMSSRATRARMAAFYRGHYVFETDLREATRYRLPGEGEARGVFTWDEAHNDLNNRTYKEREQAQLEWATQLRKLGFVGFLLSQHHGNTDAQLRRIANGVVMLQNQREQTRLMGLRVTPWPLFLAHWYPTHVPGNKAAIQPWRVDRYLLGWHRKLYDTMGLYHGVADADDDERVIRLPAGGRGRDAAASAPPRPIGDLAA